MSECLFPTCSRAAQSNGYCLFHRMYSNSSEEIKMPKEPNKKSDNQKAIDKELKKLYPIFLAKHPACEIKSPKCTKKATCIHHTKGRGKNEVLAVETWKASCTACNLWCETNHAEAEEKGVKKRRHHISE